MARKRDKEKANAEKTKKKTLLRLLFSPLGLFAGIFFYLFSSIVFSTLLEWSGMIFGWWDYQHAEKVLHIELKYLGDNFTTTLLGMSAEDSARVVTNYFQHWLVIPQDAPQGLGHKLISTRAWERLTAHWAFYRNAFVYVLMVTGIRCIIVMLSSVLFIVVSMLAAIDGLHLRELRKITGGVEHAGVYHRAKAMVPYTVGLSPIIYLSWPNPINPNFILLPGMGLFFMAIFVSFATFKKII
ncbi:MAG: DUF4400 domain-containing protein [Cardiobacteriaceae bacterium]|nr:DUF4400 domain-containing protein [Cardiobacteriaceae bacterium]